jgi:hypothetical protein
MKNKIKHNLKCDVCGKPATINLQNQWHEYEIDKNGEFKESSNWEGDCNEFYCDECYEKQANQD